MTTVVAVETSTLVQSVAVAVDGHVVAEVTERKQRGHSKDLARTMVALLDEGGWRLADVDAFAVDIGPGSFTGLRVGLSLVKGIAAVHGMPVLPVRSVDAAAAEWPGDGPVAVAWDAHNRTVYGAVVVPCSAGPDLVPLGGWSPSEFAERVTAHPDALLRGDGWARYEAEFRAAGFEPTGADSAPPTARGVMAAALAVDVAPVAAHGVEPLYVRRSAAEERRRA